jgi:hypothetical protein
MTLWWPWLWQRWWEVGMWSLAWWLRLKSWAKHGHKRMRQQRWSHTWFGSCQWRCVQRKPHNGRSFKPAVNTHPLWPRSPQQAKPDFRNNDQLLVTACCSLCGWADSSMPRPCPPSRVGAVPSWWPRLLVEDLADVTEIDMTSRCILVQQIIMILMLVDDGCLMLFDVMTCYDLEDLSAFLSMPLPYWDLEGSLTLGGGTGNFGVPGPWWHGNYSAQGFRGLVPLTEASILVRLTVTWNPGPRFCSLNLWISFMTESF